MKKRYCDICHAYKEYLLFVKKIKILEMELNCFEYIYKNKQISEKDKQFISKNLNNLYINHASFEERKKLVNEYNETIFLMCHLSECEKITQDELTALKEKEQEFLKNYMIIYRELQKSVKQNKTNIIKLKGIIRSNYPNISNLFKLDNMI